MHETQAFSVKTIQVWLDKSSVKGGSDGPQSFFL